MMQATIVALIWDKPKHLLDFLDKCRERVSNVLQEDFRSYDIKKQIHATIVGLERVDAGNLAFENKNFKKYRQRKLEMDYAGLLDYLRTSSHFPMQIQIGGFHNRDYPFISRNERPFQRSFSIQPGRTQDGKEIEYIVVMGWPLRGEPSTNPNPALAEVVQETTKYPRSLDCLRRAAQTFNVLHAYHRAPTDVDNDFFFRIGIIDNPRNVDVNKKQQLANSMRDWLARYYPVILDVRLSDVYLTQYASTELPPDNRSTNCHRIDNPKINADFCRALY